MSFLFPLPALNRRIDSYPGTMCILWRSLTSSTRNATHVGGFLRSICLFSLCKCDCRAVAIQFDGVFPHFEAYGFFCSRKSVGVTRSVESVEPIIFTCEGRFDSYLGSRLAEKATHNPIGCLFVKPLLQSAGLGNQRCIRITERFSMEPIVLPACSITCQVHASFAGSNARHEAENQWVFMIAMLH